MDTPNTYSLIDMIVKRYTDALDLIEQSPSVAHHGGLQAVDAQRDGREIASGFPALEPQPMEDAAATEATGAAVVAEYLDAVNVGPHAKYCRLCVMWLNGPIQFDDHTIGKKHKKNLRKLKQDTQGGQDGEGGMGSERDR